MSAAEDAIISLKNELRTKMVRLNKKVRGFVTSASHRSLSSPANLTQIWPSSPCRPRK